MKLGLTDEEVKISRSKYGSNILKKQHKNSFLRLVIESLGDPIIKILLIALAIKLVFLFKNFDWYETIGILIAVFLASFISSISEYGSNSAFERMQKENEEIKVKVYRNGSLREIKSSQVVVGDVIKLTSGDKIPADGHLVSGFLNVDESFLSGETKEIYKKTGQDTLVYAGSVIYKGEAIIITDKIGDETYIGKISMQMQSKSEESPLKSKLRILAKQISLLGYIGAFLATVSYLFMQIVVNNHFDGKLIIDTITNFPLMMDYLIYSLTLCVTIIIMAVPEGLPMMITLVLSSNMKKMLKDNVLVRKLVGIETSGSLNVLLCDKTGTLTEGKLKVNKIIAYDKGFSFINDITKHRKYFDVLIKSISFNNEATISNNKVIGGNSTDIAIKEYVKKFDIRGIITKKQEFTSENKYSYVLVNGNYYVKGASEKLLKKCKYYLDLNGNKKALSSLNKIEKEVNLYTEKGYRVLLNAFGESLENLTFISLIIISDNLRVEAKKSVEIIEEAGIKVVMITGDAKKTAISIAKKLNMIKSDSIILDHDELVKLTDEKLFEMVPKVSVVARALPEDKARLVDIYKKAGKVVGMTGDGVNDAIALKKSDVGFALGSAQEVAKEASDIVILDNNIFSICKAVLYGRTIFKSIRKFIIYQLTVNICALILSIIGTLIGVATPITIIQMLWLNMIMDTFAGLAFSYEAPLLEYMKEPPKKKNEKIMSRYMINQIIVNGFYSSVLCILFLKLPIFKNLIRSGENYHLTAFFALFIFLGIINAFLARTHRLNLFANILKNKVFMIINGLIIVVQIFIIYYGGNLFRTYGLTLNEMILVITLSLSILPIDLLRKFYLKKKHISLGV